MADAPDALFASDLSPGAKMLGALLWRFATHGEARPWVFPSVSTLAAKTGQNDRSVRRQLEALRAAGLVTEAVRTYGGRFLRGWVLHADPVEPSRDVIDLGHLDPEPGPTCPPTRTEESAPDPTTRVEESGYPDRDVRAPGPRSPETRTARSAEAPMKPHEAPMKPQRKRAGPKAPEQPLLLPAEPAGDLEGPSTEDRPPGQPVKPRQVLLGELDHLSPKAAAKHLPLLEAFCEGHRKVWQSPLARSPKAEDAKHLRALLRDEKRKPSDVMKAIIGMERDPWPERRQHNRWSHLRRDFDKYRAWFDQPPDRDPGRGGGTDLERDRAERKAASRRALEEANGLHRRPA